MHFPFTRILVALFLPLATASVCALEFRDYQTVGVTLDSLGIVGNQQYTGVLNIKTPGSPSSIIVPDSYPVNGTFTDAGGYDPTTMSVSTATLTIWISDNSDGGRSDTVRISLRIGPGQAFNNQLVHEGFTTEFSVFDGQVQGFALVHLSETGILEYRVRAHPSSETDPSTGNKFPSVFTVEYAGLVAQVPDGGLTLFLLGMSILGLASLRRPVS